MQVYPIKYKDMNIFFLMALLRQKNVNKEKIIKVLSKRLDSFKLNDLISIWNIEKNNTLKEVLEIAIAKKIINYNQISHNTKMPNFIKRYLNNVTSLDAICLLLKSKNEDIRQVSYSKYQELIDAYLESFDFIYYENEGDDSFLCNNNNKIIKYSKRKRKDCK